MFSTSSNIFFRAERCDHAVNITFDSVFFFFSPLIFVFIGILVAATHTSAQFYSHFSSKHIETFVRIFICTYLSQLKAIQWRGRRRQQPLIRTAAATTTTPTTAKMVTTSARHTQTHKSKGFSASQVPTHMRAMRSYQR